MNTRSCLIGLLALLLPVVAAAETVDTAWVRRYDGPNHGEDWATCIAVDSQDSVIVAGASEGYDSTYDWVIIKYSPDGDELWTRQLAYYMSDDVPYGLGVDAQGDDYVTGYAHNQIAVVKYSPTGQLLWALPDRFPGGGVDLALDDGGNVLLYGEWRRSTSDFVTVKYQPNGDTAWVRALDWANNTDAVAALLSFAQITQVF